MSKKTTVSLRVSYLCKVCSQLFKSVEKYCAHKIEYHYMEFKKNASFVFEESFLEPDENENSNGSNNFGYGASTPAETATQQNLSKLLKDRDRDAIKLKPPKLKPKPNQEPPPPPNNISIPKTPNENPLIDNPVSILALSYGDGQSHSGLKTEWIENTKEPEVEYETYDQESEENPSCSTNLVYIPQTNAGHSINYYDETEGSFGSEDEDPEPDADVQDSRLYHDPLEYGPPSCELTLSQTDTAHQEFDDRNNCESDDIDIDNDNDSDIVCLDDYDPPTPTPAPSAAKAKKATSMTSTRKTGKYIAFPPLPKKPQCQFCGKQFLSNAQLGMHVAKCHLYSKVREKQPPVVAAAVDFETGTGSGSGSGGKRSSRSLGGNGNDQMLKCYLCPAIIKSCNLKRHLKAHKICVGDPNKKFVCSICGFGFRINSQLQEHAKAHTNERPFSCPSPNCESVFKYRRNLRQHIRTFHDDLIEMLQ